MTKAATEIQTCPFCCAELDARAVVCGNCQAVKDITPGWFHRLKFYGLSGGLFLGGLLFTFFDGRGINWWAVPVAVIGAIFLAMSRKMNFSDQLWHRNE